MVVVLVRKFFCKHVPLDNVSIAQLPRGWKLATITVMGKHVFISYCHKQREWVHDRLLPVLRAAGCGVEIDAERGQAGQGVLGQMDAWQDQAEVSLLVLTPQHNPRVRRRKDITMNQNLTFLVLTVSTANRPASGPSTPLT